MTDLRFTEEQFIDVALPDGNWNSMASLIGRDKITRLKFTNLTNGFSVRNSRNTAIQLPLLRGQVFEMVGEKDVFDITVLEIQASGADNIVGSYHI